VTEGQDTIERPLANEVALEPSLPIIDPHHHLWLDDAGHGTALRYTIDDFTHDVSAGHKVIASVYVECSSCYRRHGPAHLRPAGETEWVASLAPGPGLLAGAVGYADVRLASGIAETLDAHQAALGPRFKGLRCSAAWDPSPEVMPAGHDPEPGLLRSPQVESAVRLLAARDLLFETWVYHHQLTDVASLAAAVPECRIVLAHLGGPIAVGPYRLGRERMLSEWRRGMSDVAACPNVFLKIGGIGLPPLVEADLRASLHCSEALARYWRREVLGASRRSGPSGACSRAISRLTVACVTT
jgi:predicted TIM-barrel fold metal-dependent hydrolase